MNFFSDLLGSRNLIYIHTEKQQYYSGEQVGGTISLSVVEPIRVDGVYIKIKGYQRAAFNTSEVRYIKDKDDPQKTNTEHYAVRRHQTNVFFRRKYCVYSYKSILQCGNYVFPFQFNLDHGLPGAFSLAKYGMWNDGNQFEAEVRYKVKAEVAIPGLFKPNIKHHQDILICEPLERAIMSSDCYKEANVTFFCCIPKGQLSAAANIDRNAYGPGDLVNVRLIVDNSASQVDLDRIALRLERAVTLRAQGYEKTSKETIIQASSHRVVRGEKADRTIQMLIPHHALPSTKATLVFCEYKLKVDMVVPWSPNVTLSQPVQIYAPVLASYVVAVPVMPAAMVMPVADLQQMPYQKY